MVTAAPGPVPLLLAGNAASLAGALLVYLASPNQPLLKNPDRRRWLAWLGLLGLMAGLGLLLAGTGPAKAVFIVVTQAMLVWSVAPLAVAWWCRPREERP